VGASIGREKWGREGDLLPESEKEENRDGGGLLCCCSFAHSPSLLTSDCCVCKSFVALMLLLLLLQAPKEREREMRERSTVINAKYDKPQSDETLINGRSPSLIGCVTLLEPKQ